jgi:hypothetical protein
MRARRGADFQALGAWAGIIGPLLFISVFTIEGGLRAGYDPWGMFVSALSMGPRGVIQITNFIVSGALIAIFSGRVAVEFKVDKAWPVGPLLLLIVGLSLVGSGPFVMDPVTVPFLSMSWHSYLHYLFGILVFSLAPISCFAFFTRFRVDERWEWFTWWTLAAGLIMTGSVFALKIAMAPGSLHPFAGAVQRFGLIVYLLWMAWFGLALAMKPGNRPIHRGRRSASGGQPSIGGDRPRRER